MDGRTEKSLNQMGFVNWYDGLQNISRRRAIKANSERAHAIPRDSHSQKASVGTTLKETFKLEWKAHRSRW